MDKQPTAEQVERFWEWCGFKPRIGSLLGNEHIVAWKYPNKENRIKVPRLDLNNLFKWAVPKLERENWYDYIHFGFDHAEPKISTVQITLADKLVGAGESDDPALALFWAIYEIVEGGK